MEELSYSAKIAVIKVLKEILHADYIVHESEVKYLNEVISSFQLDDNYQSDVENLLTLQALATIRVLPVDQKSEVAKMMGNMIVADENIDYNEVKLYNAFCKSCDIDRDFNVNDYPEYTLSGPFINPEDLMNSTE